MVKVTMKIGNQVIECQANSAKDVHKFSSIYGMVPQKCDACQSTDIFLNWKNIKGNEYYGVKCRACSAELNFHQKKEGGFYLVIGEKMVVYVPLEEQPAAPGQPAQQTPAGQVQTLTQQVENVFAGNDSEVPF